MRKDVQERKSVSKRPFPTSQSIFPYDHNIDVECIKEAVPDQPELLYLWNSETQGVYQRGRSRPARASEQEILRVAGSVSKRPFPTSQSEGDVLSLPAKECIKEAVPDQPERTRLMASLTLECIKEAVPDQPEHKPTSGEVSG